MKAETVAKVVTAARDLSLGLTLLASLPYSMGDVATIMPPSVKQIVATVGCFATMGLALLSTITKPSFLALFTENKPDVIDPTPKQPIETIVVNTKQEPVNVTEAPTPEPKDPAP